MKKRFQEEVTEENRGQEQGTGRRGARSREHKKQGQGAEDKNNPSRRMRRGGQVPGRGGGGEQSAGEGNRGGLASENNIASFQEHK